MSSPLPPGLRSASPGHIAQWSPDFNLPSKKEYVFVCAGVGDCKAYAFLQKERKVIDLTSRNREASENDASDPGGRLGPYVDNQPDLRNCEIR